LVTLLSWLVPTLGIACTRETAGHATSSEQPETGRSGGQENETPNSTSGGRFFEESASGNHRNASIDEGSYGDFGGGSTGNSNEAP